jgi:hypothetical protein
MAITPGTTNFLQWNPNATNQETDAQYSADSSRENGWITNSIVPSPTLNKAMFQVSTMIAALAQMLANKGFSPEDSNLAALVSVLTNIQTTADLKAPLQTVPFSLAMTFDASQANAFEVQVTTGTGIGNYTFSLINTTPGQIITLIFVMTVNSARNLTYPANVIGGSPVTRTLGTTNIQQFFVASDGNAHAISMLANN